MSKNIVFVFSGTGNSLWAANKIAEELGDCEIASMGANAVSFLRGGYDSIGFVYPTYAGGMPKRVKDFVRSLNLENNQSAYFFVVATCGRVARAQNVITQMRHLLKRKGINLSYGERLDMFSNYVIGYEMRETVLEETVQSAKDLRPMIKSIQNHATNKGSATTPRQLESMGFMLIVSKMDKSYRVSDACIACGICQKVCPVQNIELGSNEKPRFQHHCELCLACIQNCPTRAIDYKDKTQGRRRYTHPDITWKELAVLNGNDE